MSNMKNGFCTLNRWLGRKNKEKATPNGKLSKSSTNLNLSVSSTNINEASQLEYNRITPLPVATSNAPFEQTFRITVLLPKDQLYVARLGARVPLSKLLELVCENKQLEEQKYEFRNPVDPSQTYGCDLTIGAVGLSEIRLCHKSEAYDTFNADEMIKLQRTSIIRDSLSSSEYSSRNSKQTMKTASPYSSSNSLNSMDSNGMSYTRNPVGTPSAVSATTTPKLMAPPRKKRAAPRPPSQTAIPERSPLIITNGRAAQKAETNGLVPSENAILSAQTMPEHKDKDFRVSTPTSTPGIANNSILSVDCNGNSEEKRNQNDINAHKERKIPLGDSQVEQKNARNLCNGESVQNPPIISSVATSQSFPEPSPRKRILQIKKKAAAPAPPPRNSESFDDTVSIKTITQSTREADVAQSFPTTLNHDSTLPTSASTPSSQKQDIRETPKPNPRLTPEFYAEAPPAEISSSLRESMSTVPKPVPRVTTATAMNIPAEGEAPIQPYNVSKIMLNRTPTPEPRSLPTETPVYESHAEDSMQEDVPRTHLLNESCDKNNSAEDDDNCSKQADSGIGEPVPPSPLPDSLPSEGSAMEGKLSTFESSSDDDDMVKVYNFKLGKTLLPPGEEQAATEEEVSMTDTNKQVDRPESTDTPDSVMAETASVISDAVSWNFQIPISPPPNFADKTRPAELFDEAPDAPITPKIMERPVLDFNTIAAIEGESAAESAAEPEGDELKSATETDSAALKKPVIENVPDLIPPPVVPPESRSKEIRVECNGVKDTKTKAMEANAHSPLPNSPLTAPMNEIIDELHAILNEQRIENIIRKPEEASDIESARPNSLSNFSIACIAQPQSVPSVTRTPSATPGHSPSSPESSTDEEKLYRKRSSIAGNAGGLFKQRRSITRADSFHATMQQTRSSSAHKAGADLSPQESLNSRCSSYLSLTKLDQSTPNLQRRRSSSELSIGESPSLQSLEVIKTILNSRKNSFNGVRSDGETKSLRRGEPSREGFETPEPKPKKTAEAREREARSTPPETKEEKLDAEKSLPKVYRYSGPPSINFSTWSERPKVQVAIKNEGDYIFGGKQAANQNAAVTSATVEISNTLPATRGLRVSAPVADFRDFRLRALKSTAQGRDSKQEREEVETQKAPELKPKPLTTAMRMGISEKPHAVPATVKPTEGGDRTVESMSVELRSNVIESVRTPTHSVKERERNLEAAVALHSAAQYGNPSTLPRSTAYTRFSMPAPGPSLLRSTSITQLEKKQPKSTMTAAPFGQNTLRKTGFKEKILAQATAAEEQSERNQFVEDNISAKCAMSAAQSSAQHVNEAQTHNQTHTTHSPQKTPTKSLQSAKLELKLQKSTSIYVNHLSSAHAPAPNISLPSPALAPPPTPVGISSGRKAQRNGSTVVTPTSDPREQLLDAIRNFKREELNRS